MSVANCHALTAALTPSQPLDDATHLRNILAEIEKMEKEKMWLDDELRKIRAALPKTTQQATLKNQAMQYIKRGKEIERRNLALVGQYDELCALRGDRELVNMSARTAALFKEHASHMRQDMRQLGGAEGVRTALENIADVKQDAQDLIAFSSRALIPDGMQELRDTGVLPTPLTIEEELDQYLGLADQEESRPASSIQESPPLRLDPYTPVGELIAQ